MLVALLISLLAGLATSVGGVLALSARTLQRSWLAAALAFASGAMLFVSFVQIVPLGISLLQDTQSDATAQFIMFTAFFAGVSLVLIIDRLLPEPLNPNETEGREEEVSSGTELTRTRSLMRSGILVAVVLSLHNFPEGMATFFTAYSDLQIGLTLGVAIAVHNIPEGIAVAAPVYAATGSRRKALAWATGSGLTEPVGGLLAAALVAFVIPDAFFGVFYGVVAGMMVFLALDELLPGAWRYQTDKHQTVYGMLAGMSMVALSIVLFSL